MKGTVEDRNYNATSGNGEDGTDADNGVRSPVRVPLERYYHAESNCPLIDCSGDDHFQHGRKQQRADLNGINLKVESQQQEDWLQLKGLIDNYSPFEPEKDEEEDYKNVFEYTSRSHVTCADEPIIARVFARYYSACEIGVNVEANSPLSGRVEYLEAKTIDDPEAIIRGSRVKTAKHQTERADEDYQPNTVDEAPQAEITDEAILYQSFNDTLVILQPKSTEDSSQSKTTEDSSQSKTTEDSSQSKTTDDDSQAETTTSPSSSSNTGGSSIPNIETSSAESIGADGNYWPNPYYPKVSLDTNGIELYRRLDVETLLLSFYLTTGTPAQKFAAQLLMSENWRYHSGWQLWFRPYEQPEVLTKDYEIGTFLYFCTDNLKIRSKKNFMFEFKYLEKCNVITDNENKLV